MKRILMGGVFGALALTLSSCIIGKTRCDEVQNQMRLLEG